MAILSKASFESKWTTLFADNATRDISEADMRAFMQDISDTFFNITSSTVDFVGVTRSSAASLLLTDPARYVHTGAGADWDMPAGSGPITGSPYVISCDPAATGAINLYQSDGVTLIMIVDPGVSTELYWDGNSKFIQKQ
jgi:hypothetical protein